MSGKVKKILVAVSLLLILGGVGVYFLLPSTINWDKFGQELAAQVQTVTGSKLIISGTPVFSMRPTPTVKFKRVVLKNAAGGTLPDMLVAPSMEVTLDSGALFRRKFVIKKITLTNPQLFFEEIEPGRWNYQFNFLRNYTPATDFRFESILVSDALVTVKEQNKPEYTQNFNVELFADSLKGPFSLEGTTKLFDADWRFSVKIPKLEAGTLPAYTIYLIHVPSETLLSFSGAFSEHEYNVWEGTVDFDIRKTDLAFKMFFPDDVLPSDFFAPLSGNVTLSLNTQTKAFTLKDLLFKYGTSSASGQLSLKHSSVAPQENANAAEEGTAAQTSELTGELNITRFALEPLVAHPNEMAAFIVKKSREFANAAKTDIKVNLDTFEYNRDNVRYAKFNLHNRNGVPEVSDFETSLPGNAVLKGAARLSVKDEAAALLGSFKLDADNVGTTLRWLNIPVPAEVPQNLLRSAAVRSMFLLSEKDVRFTEVDLKLDLTEAKGAALFGRGENKMIYVSADVNELNFDAYFPEKRTAAKALTDEFIKKSPSDKVRFLFERLAFLNDRMLRLNVAAQLMTVADIKTQNFILKGDVRGGVLSLEELSATDFLNAAVSFKGAASGFGGVPSFPDKGMDVVFETKRLKNFGKDFGIDIPQNFERFIGSDSVSFKGRFVGVLDKMNVNLFAGFGKFSFDALGSVALTPTGVNFDVAVSRLKHDSFRNFVRFFSEKYRPVSQKNVELTFMGRVVKSDNDYRIDLDNGTRLDAQDVSGYLDIKQAPQKPMVFTAELEFSNQFDVSPLLPDMKLRIPGVQANGKQAIFAFLGDKISFQKTAPDFSFLSDYTASVKFKAEGLLWEDMLLKNANGSLLLEPGKISLTIDEALWNDAAFNGDAVLTVQDGMTLTSKMNLEGLKSVAGVFGAEDVDLSFDSLNASVALQGTGATAADVFSSLEGKGTLHFDNASFHKLNLPAAEKMLSDRKLPSQQIFDEGISTGKTIFEKVSAPFEIVSAKLTMMPIEMTAKGKTYAQNKLIYDFPTQQLESSFEFPVSGIKDAPLLKKQVLGDEVGPTVHSNSVAVLNFFVKEHAEAEKKMQARENEKKRQERLERERKTEALKETVRPVERQMIFEADAAAKKYEEVIEISKKTTLDKEAVFLMQQNVKRMAEFSERVQALLRQEEVKSEDIKSVEDYYGLKIPEFKQKIQQFYDLARLAMARKEIIDANTEAQTILTAIIQKTVQHPDMDAPSVEATRLFKEMNALRAKAEKNTTDMTQMTIRVGEAQAALMKMKAQEKLLDDMIKQEADRLAAEEKARQDAEQKRIEEERRLQEAALKAQEEKARAQKKTSDSPAGINILRASGTKTLKIKVNTADDAVGETQTPSVSDSESGGSAAPSPAPSTGIIIRRN